MMALRFMEAIFGYRGGLVPAMTDPPPDLSKWEPIVVEISRGVNLDGIKPIVGEVPTYEESLASKLASKRKPSTISSFTSVDTIVLQERVPRVSYAMKPTVAVSTDDYDAFMEWKKSQECPEPTVLEPKKLRLIDVE